MFPWHKDNFELKTVEKKQIKGSHSAFPLFAPKQDPNLKRCPLSPPY